MGELALGLVLVGTIPAAINAQQAEAIPGSLVFNGVTVVDVEQGKLIPGRRVVVVGNRIQAVGDAKAVSAPAGARVVDAGGKYLIPGLWDTHTHPQRHATDFYYPLFIANGVTGIRDPGSEVPLDTLHQWRREILAGTRVGPPRQIFSGKYIDGHFDERCRRNRRPTGTAEFVVCLADSADAVHYVDSLKAAGADMIKIHSNGLSPQVYFVVAAEARRRGIPFGGHVPPEISPTDASDSGARILDHLDASQLLRHCAKSVSQCQPIAQRLRRNGTWFTPTLWVDVTNLRYQPKQGFPLKNTTLIFDRLDERVRQFWAGALPRGNWLRDSTDSVKLSPDSNGALYIMERVGVPIVAGTDIVDVEKGPGFGLHAELMMEVLEGLTPLNALQSATLNPAKMWHATDSLGTVAPGKLADLVLLDADPLADITNTTTIRAVVANGRYFDRAALDGLLTEVRAKAEEEP